MVLGMVPVKWLDLLCVVCDCVDGAFLLICVVVVVGGACSVVGVVGGV